MPSLDRVRKLCTNEKLKSEMKVTASPPKKEANPASLRSAAPSKGRGSRGYSLLPLEGGAPKGRRLDGGKRYERERGRSSQVRRLREYPIHRCAVPLPQGGRLRNENTAFLETQPFLRGVSKEEAASPLKKEANPASLRSAAPSKGRGSRGYSLLPLEGGAPKGRRLAWVIPDQDHEILDV